MRGQPHRRGLKDQGNRKGPPHRTPPPLPLPYDEAAAHARILVGAGLPPALLGRLKSALMGMSPPLFSFLPAAAGGVEGIPK